jgi:DUF1680 family protein
LLIADHTRADYADPVDQIQRFSGVGVKGRYVRVTATKLRSRQEQEKVYYFALAKMDVLSGGKNRAEGCPVADSVNGKLGATPLTRPARPQGEGIVTDNPNNVTAARKWKPPAYRAHAPLGGVQMDGGPLRTAFENNIGYLLNSFTADELLKQFRDRAGKPNPLGLRKPHQFWEEDLAGSNAGRFLMGAGNAVRWTDHAELRHRMNQVVQGIKECRQPNGYIMAYPEDTIFYSERGAYTRAWLTHGLIEAGYGGNPEAFHLLRGYYDWFDRCPYLPKLLRGAIQGVQGMIGNTRMYFTPAGKPRDIQVIQQYFQENYWLEQLAGHEERAIWQYPYDRPHCYLITALEAYMDLYRATGERRYLDAVSGGWDLYHDKWEHVGGTIAICEWDVYRPRSYRLHAHTGELCGSVFWAFLNQRMHSLDPQQEKYVNEIEKSIYNAALANQVGTQGIRYHTNLIGWKDPIKAIPVNTCCAGQGTRLLAALPEFIYSLAADGLFVNLFEASTIAWRHGGRPMKLRMATRFPFGPEVELKLSVARPVHARIHLRVPAWAAKEMPILVNGSVAASGKAGAYAVLDRAWKDGDTISFVVPMDFRLTRYTGEDKVPGQEQYALEYGPLLMALFGQVDEKQGAQISERPQDLIHHLRPVAGRPLQFSIDGDPQHAYMPYWLLEDQVFTCYPLLGRA